jgi:peptidoglycan/xylan/chitin deacetylase (PgdA/CDA1 family)
VIGAALGLAAAGGALTWIGYAWAPHLLTWGCVWRAPRAAGRRIALTFDDGPDPTFTPKVVELLAARGVRATFFLVGERATRAPDVVRGIAAAGHEIASHGWSHRSLWLCGPSRTDDEVGRARAALADVTGAAPALFRPPWGMVNAAMFGALRRHAQRCVFWSVQPEGLRPVAAAAQVGHVLRRAHAGAIVDLHDAEGTPGAPARLCAALPGMLDGLAEAGYGFGTVSELLAS